MRRSSATGIGSQLLDGMRVRWPPQRRKLPRARKREVDPETHDRRA
jgi:hypothetical protein